jgi:hypothetical protein
MDFHSYTTMRDWTRRSMPEDRFANDPDHFYKKAMADAVRVNSAQFLAQLINERDWERQRRPMAIPNPASLSTPPSWWKLTNSSSKRQ